MDELKPCPFCGGSPEFIDNSGERDYKNKVTVRPGRTFLRKETRSYGSRGKTVDFYVYMVDDYQVQCSTKGCLVRNTNKHYHSKDEAIEAWNRRATP